MFTGIVQAVGQLVRTMPHGDGLRLVIEVGALGLDDVKPGDSVAVAGCCLTVVAAQGNTLSFDVSAETLRCTARLDDGARVNLEKALRLSDRLGGHLVTGHIDAIARVKKVSPDGFSKLITFELNSELSPFFVEKGSVAVDGVSLTIVVCDAMPAGNNSHTPPPFTFTVALIPYTLEHTTLGSLAEGDPVNVETDVIARYVARWLAPNLAQNLQIQSSLAKILNPEAHNAAAEHTEPVQLRQ